jgi:tRNA-specific 2-thiouridylase
LLVPIGKKIKVTFKQPQFAVTPGQSAVFYDKDTVLGGGIIE